LLRTSHASLSVLFLFVVQPTATDVFLDCCPEVDLYDFDGVIVEQDYALAAYGFEEELLDAASSAMAADNCLGIVAIFLGWTAMLLAC